MVRISDILIPWFWFVQSFDGLGVCQLFRCKTSKIYLKASRKNSPVRKYKGITRGKLARCWRHNTSFLWGSNAQIGMGSELSLLSRCMGWERKPVCESFGVWIDFSVVAILIYTNWTPTHQHSHLVGTAAALLCSSALVLTASKPAGESLWENFTTFLKVYLYYFISLI